MQGPEIAALDRYGGEQDLAEDVADPRRDPAPATLPEAEEAVEGQGSGPPEE
jgi:hypothetical protein